MIQCLEGNRLIGHGLLSVSLSMIAVKDVLIVSEHTERLGQISVDSCKGSILRVAAVLR